MLPHHATILTHMVMLRNSVQLHVQDEYSKGADDNILHILLYSNLPIFKLNKIIMSMSWFLWE